MDQKQIREEIEKLIKKSYKEIDKVFAERLKEILNQIKKLLMKIEGKDPHIGWTEINKFRRLDSELKRIEKDLEDDHKKIAENINNLKEKTYLDTFLKHTYLFEQATKDRFLTAIPDMKLVRKMLDQPIKFIKLDESLKKERKRALKRIRADITLGVLNGEGFKKIAKRLRTSLGMTVKQSKRVARTEGGRAMEQAAFDSAQVAKKYGARMHKIWEATLDLRTRPSHQVLDHQMKDIDEPFEINGCKGMHPKGFVGPGSAGENINCRCTVIYSVNGILPDTRRVKINEKGSYQVPYQSYSDWLKVMEDFEISRMKRNKSKTKRKPVNAIKQKHLTKDFRDRGGLIWQDDDAESYLKDRSAHAMCLNEETIVLNKKPTISEILEELYHAEQWKSGELNGEPINRIECEIKAQKYLLSVSKEYNIPKEEIKETMANLDYWEKELKRYEN